MRFENKLSNPALNPDAFQHVRCHKREPAMHRSKAPPLFLVFIAIALGGCASSHDLRKGPGAFGGGVMHEEVRPGLFKVRAQTNWAPWPNEGSASSAWSEEATKACKGAQFKEINTKVSTRDTGMASMGPLLRYLVSEKYGYALCQGAETTEEEAAKLLY